MYYKKTYKNTTLKNKADINPIQQQKTMFGFILLTHLS